MTRPRKSLLIPVSLAKLLAAGPSDLKDRTKYRQIHDLARAQLRMLLAMRRVK